MSSYTVERNGAVCTIAISGDFEVAMIAELQPIVRQELEKEAMEVVFDFRQTTLLDSSGIGLLIATGNTLTKKNGTVRVINVPADIMRVFSSMRLVPRLNAVGCE
jgi:anti-sigma B factor antagonist